MTSLIAEALTVDLSPYAWPVFEPDEIEAVSDVLRSGKVNYWTGGVGREFESEFARYFGVRRAVAMANGTVTLQACLRALRIGPGDEVVTTPRTFIGSSSAIVMEGARPIMADVDRDSGVITPETIERVITSKTRAIIPVHLAGWPCDMEGIMALARSRGLYVIEDCAQCHGATIRDRHCGTFGHLASWSFCQDKIVTTGGEGGMVATDDEALWKELWSLKDHGKSHDTVFEAQHPPGFRWLHEGWGTNWRLTEMQSAIGLRQLAKLSDWSDARRRRAHIIEEALRPLAALRVPVVPDHVRHAYYKLYVYVRPEALRPDWNRDRILSELNAAGVPGLSGSCCEIYREKSFTEFGLAPPERLPNARDLGDTSIMFLVHPTLPEPVVHRVAEIAVSVMGRATA